MRELLFRGKCEDSDKWVFGLPRRRLRLIDDTWYIDEETAFFSHKIRKETIGQYTDLRDVNNKKIFEGDIFKFTEPYDGKPIYGVVKYRNTYSELRSHNPCGFVIEWIDNNGILREDLPYWCDLDLSAEVVGNIYDNPELLEV
ncbi:MAG: YopX family protein [Clostridiales bacterium]|nr:YopX family protein [Clostridiales bacterium]